MTNRTERDQRTPQPSVDEINIDDESECARWSRQLGVSAGELKAAVHHAGRRAADVRRYLEERTLPHDPTPWGTP